MSDQTMRLRPVAFGVDAATPRHAGGGHGDNGGEPRHRSERDHDIAATLDAIRMLLESEV